MFAVSRRRKINFVTAIMATLVVAFAMMTTPPLEAQETTSIVGSSPLPGLSGATDWLNSAPLTAKQLKGKVVLVDFWDYSCINCIRAMPYRGDRR